MAATPRHVGVTVFSRYDRQILISTRADLEIWYFFGSNIFVQVVEFVHGCRIKHAKTCYIAWTSCSQHQGSTVSKASIQGKKNEGTNTPCDFDHEHQLFRHHHAMWNLTLGLMSEFFLWWRVSWLSISPSTTFDAIPVFFDNVFRNCIRGIESMSMFSIFQILGWGNGLDALQMLMSCSWAHCVTMPLPSATLVFSICDHNQWMSCKRISKPNEHATTWRNHDVFALPKHVLSLSRGR